jgi:preprotein translocase subunit SecD
MSVDANVLIFERIREELRRGKTVRTAIEAGYERAFGTILDSNVTTLITAFVLWQFGSGPVRGFATTLSIGILVSMFTALMCTRVVYDFVTTRRHVEKLSV